jgi:hypothetical protein
MCFIKILINDNFLQLIENGKYTIQIPTTNYKTIGHY